MPFGVGNQLDRYVVYAGILRERSVGELRQLLVIPAGQVCPDFPNVLLDDVGIVQ